jgi:Tfp pilus assembly protein PilO
MIIDSSWQTWKKWTGAALALLLVADIALAFLLWRSSSIGPVEMRAQRDDLALQARLLKADVERGEKIRASLPQVGKDCEDFYQRSFLSASTGYSSVETDLGAIAAKAGLKTSGFAFTQHDVKDRGVTEMTITTSVDGNYESVIQFINGLERSRNFYLLNNLSLTSATSGEVKLQLELQTYFRT